MTSPTPAKPVRELLDEAKRHLALKSFTAAADSYAEALESLRETHDEDSPLLAPVFHRYGHALLEHAISTSGALGGGGGSGDAPMPTRSAKKSGSSPPPDPRFSFGGDGPDSDDEDAAEGAEGAAPGEGGEEEEEDDLSVAFSVLELARVRYEKILELGGDQATLTTLDDETWGVSGIKAQLAEVLNDLGDVGLESENFQQASADYEAALQHLTPLLHAHSRRLADAYLRLGLALEFHPDADRRRDAEKYVRAAATALSRRREAVQARLATLSKGDEAARAEAAAAELREAAARAAAASDSKGKGRSQDTDVFERDDVVDMDEEKAQKELRDVQEIAEELKNKLDEYEAAPPGSSSLDQAGSAAGSDQAALKEAINEALLGASTNALAGAGAPRLDPNAPVNDLSAMVKKKKKPESKPAAAEESKAANGDAAPAAAASIAPAAEGAAESSAGKRKAEELPIDATPDASSDKRARVEDAEA